MNATGLARPVFSANTRSGLRPRQETIFGRPKRPPPGSEGLSPGPDSRRDPHEVLSIHINSGSCLSTSCMQTIERAARKLMGDDPVPTAVPGTSEIAVAQAGWWLIDHTVGMRDATARRLSRLHASLYRATRGRIGGRLVNNDMLLLTTKGHSSGRAHTVPLLYLAHGSTLLVIASWGGRDYHPDWYLNLVTHPQAVVNVNGSRRAVVARTASEEEREVWWPRVKEAYGGYEVYQDRTDRQIPLVFLEPDG